MPATTNPDPLVLSNTNMTTYRRCPRLYEYKYIKKLEPKKTAVQLKRGVWLHACLEAHYKQMAGVQEDGWREEHERQTEAFRDLFVEEQDSLGDMPTDCGRILRAYFRYYKDDKFKVIAVELDETLDLKSGDKFRIIVDLLVEMPDGSQWIWDHKTVGSFMPDDYLLIEGQLARYFWGVHKLGYTKVQGIMFNQIITKPPTVPELLKNGTLTTKQNQHCDPITYMAAIKKHGLDPKDYRDVLQRLKAQEGDRFFKRVHLNKGKVLVNTLMHEMTVTAEHMRTDRALGEFVRTTDKSCQWCDFLGPCAMELKGGDPSDLFRIQYQTKTKDRK